MQCAFSHSEHVEKGSSMSTAVVPVAARILLSLSLLFLAAQTTPVFAADTSQVPAKGDSHSDVASVVAQAVQVAAGNSHTCALDSGGGVVCWGNNGYGQLGDGTISNKYTPVDVNGLGIGVTEIAAGRYHTCALTTSGGVKCWGWNDFGQLGDGTTVSKTTPVNVSGLGGGATAISVGDSHTCALTTGGGVKCWGHNLWGQLGDGTTTLRITPVNVSGLGSGVTAIATGTSHTCALTTGGVRCWGYNFSGQLGDGTTIDRITPVAVTGLGSGVTAITAGQIHNCALTVGGGVKCWGEGSFGALGDGNNIDRHTPVDVAGLGSGVIVIAAGNSHTCALTSGGGVKCWGMNYYGTLGDGTSTTKYAPVNVTGLGSGMTAIAAGNSHTCAVSTGGGVKCWGWNDYGQIGDGTITGRLTPVTVVGFGSIVYPLCRTLLLMVDPPASGTVATSIPRNCNAGSGYADGLSLSLTASAASAYRFLGWSGAATSTSRVVNLVMNGNKSLTANFGPAQSVQKPPVIFVHGWHGRDLFAETSCSTGVQRFPDQTSVSDFGPIPSWLFEDFDVWIAHLTTSAFSTPSLDDNGACLRRQIDFVFTSTQDSQVTLIAHSMGGLVSRAAIEKTPTNNRVKTLITLGSPHLGVPAANLGGFWLCLLRDVGACEFSELGMALSFNPRYSTRNVDTNYVVVGGLARNLIPRVASFNGDGIIPQRSAMTLLGARVTAIGTQESHNNIFGFPTYMQSAADAVSLPNAGFSFRCVISPTLYGRPRPQDCNSGQMMQPTADEVPLLSQSPLISGSVASGQVVSHAAWIETSGSSVFNLNWITGTLDFTLTSPVGQVITPGFAQANPMLAQFNSIPISSPFGAMTSYGFTTTTPGLWTLWVGNSGPVGPVSYRLQVDFESPFAITTSLNVNMYAVGSTIVLTTAIGLGPAISNVQANVLFVWPNGATSAVTLTAVDSNTLTAAYVVPPTSAGYAMAQVSVSGFVNGAPFEQGSHAEFLIQSGGAKLAGAYADHAVDESATGLFNALNWEARISVTVPATYTVSADLMGGGRVIAHAQSQGFLAAGTPTVTVKFSGDAIRASHMDGPYTVTNVVLVDSSSFGLLADSANAVWTTGAYSWKGFAATCYVLTLAPNAGGTVSANPAPDCNNGLQYAAGAVVTVTATPNAGYLFSHWSDDASGESNSVTVTLSVDRAPTANFTRWPHEAFLPILLR